MPASAINLTLIGGPTLLLEVGGFRLLTDPTFDPAGGDYDIRITVLHKTGSAAQTAANLGVIDVVLLSHDQHADNLDTAGRAFLPSAHAVFSTVSGAARLALPHAVGLERWQSVKISPPTTGELPLHITGVPARHGPEGVEAMLGEVTGFVLECGDSVLYLSGDTVWYEGIAEIARRFPHIDVAVLFFGGVRQAAGEPLLTMDAAEAVLAAHALNPKTIVPIHYEGWQHFREGRVDAERTFEEAGLSEHVVWLRPGETQTVVV